MIPALSLSHYITACSSLLCNTYSTNLQLELLIHASLIRQQNSTSISVGRIVDQRHFAIPGLAPTNANGLTRQQTNRATPFSHDLTRHEAIIHNACKKEVHCQYCTVTFSRNDALLRHVRSVHEGQRRQKTRQREDGITGLTNSPVPLVCRKEDNNAYEYCKRFKRRALQITTITGKKF